VSIFINPFRLNFSPADLDNLENWYDAADVDTVVESGGSVSEWKDRSPNQYHLSQPTGANQPATGSRKINTLGAIDFNGSSHYLRNTSQPPSDIRSAFMVLHNDNLINSSSAAEIQLSTWKGDYTIGTAFGSSTGALANEVVAIFDEDTSNVFVDRQGISSTNLASIPVGDHFWTLVRLAATTGSWFMGVDGSANLQDLTSGVRHDLEYNTRGVGNGFCLGCQARDPAVPTSGLDRFFNGLIGELIMFSDELTTAERQQVEAYLSAKWAIT